MTATRHIQRGDGSVRIVRPRTWTVGDIAVRIRRDRSTATAAILLVTNGDELRHTAIWQRQAPDPNAPCQRYARTWLHRDPEGGRWTVEYGYDGRCWCLFGRDGSPWGKLLDHTLASSLAEATEYIARLHAAIRDDDRTTP